ncbi:MAG: guanylate kinase [Candidatus Omnitrophota bacterium]
MSETKNLIIIISAPSGSGKTTIVDRLLEKMPELYQLVSYATREQRKGEVDKKDYIFISKEEFKGKANRGELLEWEEVFGHFYGTSEEQLRDALEKNEDIILSIDVKGAREVRKKFPESIGIFIMPPSIEELASRLKKRNTDKDSAVSTRLKEAEREMTASDEYDYLVINEDLEKAVDEVQAIIETERRNRKKQ